MDRILGFKGPTCARKYKIRWLDYPPECDCCISRGNLHPDAIRVFEIQNGLYDHSWEYICDISLCDLPCASALGIKIHKSKSHKEEVDQNFIGTRTRRKTKEIKWEKHQELRPTIKCEGVDLKNVYKLKYLLGSLHSGRTRMLQRKLEDCNDNK